MKPKYKLHFINSNNQKQCILVTYPYKVIISFLNIGTHNITNLPLQLWKGYKNKNYFKSTIETWDMIND